MEIITQLLSEPRIWSLLSVPVGCMLVEAWVIYQLFNKYDHLQEARLLDIKKLNDDYVHLATEINNTLDIVLKLIGKRTDNGGI